MADKAGTIRNKGNISLVLNPPAAEEEGAKYDGAHVKIECDDEGGGFFVRLFGWATYTDAFGQSRSLNYHEDLTDDGLEPLKGAVADIIAAYGPAIQAKTMDAAYKARSYAMTIACPACGHTPEHPAGKCLGKEGTKTVKCKCDGQPKEGK